MLDGNQMIEAIHTIRGFLEARNIEDKLEYVRMHSSFFFSDDALGIFDEVKAGFLAHDDADFAETIDSHRAIIVRAREVGLPQTLDELLALRFRQTVQEFIDCYSWMDSYVYLGKHPELKSDNALAVLLIFGKRAHDEGNKEAEKIAIAHYNLLCRVQEVGAESAFIEVGGESFRAALRRYRS